ncbi:hypothetical protein, partial [Necropsobacter massiliensis]|uniref:hypothetical protein n=1 Tax=Necropsobacter massiliensis TaxID=1400001 RepID=UPI0005963978
DLNVICGENRCSQNSDGSYTYYGDDNLPTLSQAIDPIKNREAISLYGATGGFQSVVGGWYSGDKAVIPYKSGDISAHLVESFAGTHDMLGGQIWEGDDKQGNKKMYFVYHKQEKNLKR